MSAHRIIEKKLELVYGTVASFDVLMQNFYKLQQNKDEWVQECATRLKAALDAVRREHTHTHR